MSIPPAYDGKKNFPREVLALDTYLVTLDPTAAAFYEKVAKSANLPTEQVLADALYKLAGSLSLEALIKAREKP